MKIVIFLTSLLISSASIYACNCKTITKEDNFRLSKFIFIGKVVKTEDTFFEIEKVEVLKGDTLNSTLIALIDECSIFPNEKEKWLFYADSVASDSVYISQCGWSRKFTTNNQISIPPPRMGDPERYYDWVIKDLYAKNVQRELESDINSMRYNKALNDIQILKEQIINSVEEKREDRNNNSVAYVIIGLVIIIVLLVVKILIKK